VAVFVVTALVGSIYFHFANELTKSIVLHGRSAALAQTKPCASPSAYLRMMSVF
jgi:hypothetical protein